MGYGSAGRRPIERASKAAHSEVIRNPLVRACIDDCVPPGPPPIQDLKALFTTAPSGTGKVTAVIAIDGGYTVAPIREEYPSASIAFFTFGPLLFNLSDLAALDKQPFIGPEDMAALKNLERYSLALPLKLIKRKGSSTFQEGVRRSIHERLEAKDGLGEALQWLLFREWLETEQRSLWELPRCPQPECTGAGQTFHSGGPTETTCAICKGPVFLSDALRLYERIDEEQGAAGILGYLLTTLEQLVLVSLIRAVWLMKPVVLREILFIKDGPLAFFGTTAPLRRPMRELMKHLAAPGGDTPLINVIGIEKSGPFVEHAAMIEGHLSPGQVFLPTNEYIFRYITPGDPSSEGFGHNTYYGAKVIFKGPRGDMYVGTIPTGEYQKSPTLDALYNVGDVLDVTARLRCSMYDNALLPIALANRLVSLADVPSTAILARFAKGRLV
jgi:hypothetical protein